MASIISSPRTVEEIFEDYKSPRSGVVGALTFDVDEFYALCNPEKENLRLYGLPNGLWHVDVPALEVPPRLLETALGINFARYGMNERDWLSLVAVHSGSWLLPVAFYFGASLNRNDRKRVFTLINDLRAVFDAVTQGKPAKDKTTVDSGSKSKGGMKQRSIEGEVGNDTGPQDDGSGEERVKTFVEAVGEITMLMSSGSGEVWVRGGSTKSALG